jgi:hypothetical protein
MKLSITNHQTQEILEHEGSEEELKDWLHLQFPWLHIRPEDSSGAEDHHHDSDFEDEDPWTEAKYRRGGEEEFESEEAPDDEPEGGGVEVRKSEDLQKAVGTKGLEALGAPTTLATAFRAYKNSPHHPVSLFLKYAVHRAENEDFYQTATPEAIQASDSDWLAHHQLGGAAEKNGWKRQESISPPSGEIKKSLTYGDEPEEQSAEQPEPLVDILEDLNQSQFIEATLTEGPDTVKPEHQESLAGDDPLSSMLNHEDSRERILALKSKAITPYHLRGALFDEEPEVRQFAAQHPNLTDELIHEALKHPDPSVKSATLLRPDVAEHHLESVLDDPEIHYAVLNHPALTEAQRSYKLGEASTFAKSIGHILYPHFGIKSIPTDAMAVNQRQMENYGAIHGHVTVPKIPGSKERESGRAFFNRPQDAEVESKMPSGATGLTMQPYRKAPLLPGRAKVTMLATPGKRPTKEAQDKSLFATMGHEAQHGVFGSIKQRYGKEVGQKLAEKTLEGLTPKDSAHLHRMLSGILNLDKLNPITNKPLYSKEQIPEEKIAYMQQYLMDGHFRNNVHTNLRLDTFSGKEFQSKIKSIWQNLRKISSNLKPEHLGITPVQKSAEDQIEDWVELAKADEGLVFDVKRDMVGGSEDHEAHLEAARFLSDSTPDLALFRQSLLANKTLEESALIAVGVLPEEKNKKALRGVMALQQNAPETMLTKAEDHQIVALMPDGKSVEAAIKRGFEANKVEYLQLKGRHSKGTKLVMDPEGGDCYILKVGSGNQSPASGAREEGANQARRECVFYAIADSWGLEDFVPKADLMLIDGIELAAIQLLPLNYVNAQKLQDKDPNLLIRALEKYRDSGDLFRLSILDYVLGNTDRHLNNGMVSSARDGYILKLIDQGSSMAGKDFNPAIDRNTFVPFYLRAFAGDRWTALNPEEKLKVMPIANRSVETSLGAWINDIDTDLLEALLHRYGVNPAPTLDRLTKVKSLVGKENLSVALNALWVLPP